MKIYKGKKWKFVRGFCGVLEKKRAGWKRKIREKGKGKSGKFFLRKGKKWITFFDNFFENFEKVSFDRIVAKLKFGLMTNCDWKYHCC